MALSSASPYFARDQHTGDLMICAANSMPLPLATEDDPASQKLVVEQMFRDKAPSHPHRTAKIFGARLSQKCAYHVLMHLLSLRTSLKAITMSLEQLAQKEEVDEADICIDMLHEAYEHQTAHDIVFARHMSLVNSLADLLDGTKALWPAKWASELPMITEDVLGRRFRQLFDSCSTPRRGCVHPDFTSPGTLDAYMALSRDVEKGVEVLVQALGTVLLWYETTEYVPTTPYIVSDMLRGLIPRDSSMIIVVVGFSMKRGEAILVLKHLCWIRYFFGIIIQLSQDGTGKSHTPSPPYAYLRTGLHAKLKEDVASSHLATEDRIAMRHIAVFSNLDMLLERKPSDQGPPLSLWPETEAWKRDFPHLERNAYLVNFRMVRNAFAHQYASPVANNILYTNLFSDQMMRKYAELMMDVAKAIDLFEVALRTQGVGGTVS